MEFVIAVAIRGGLGFIFGLLFGMAAIAIVFWVSPQIWVPPLWVLALASGVGSSVAGFLAFLKPEVRWRVIGITLALALAGGIAGSLFGFWYAGEFYPEGVRNPQLVARSVRSPAISPFFLFASIFSVVIGAIYYTVRFWRYHEV